MIILIYTNEGSAYVYKWTGSSWSESAKITASDAAANDNFGHRVAISGDGNTIVVSALPNDGFGFAYVYTNDGTGWSSGTKFNPSDEEQWDYYGQSLAIAYDGSTFVISASGDDITEPAERTDAGSAYVYENTGSTWEQVLKITAYDAANSDYFGYNVRISDDEETIVVSNPYDDTESVTNCGSVYVYERDGSIITAYDGAQGDYYGYGAGGVAISGNGSIILVGAQSDDANTGSMYKYEREGTSWLGTDIRDNETKFTDSDGAQSDFFGFEVAVSNDGSRFAVSAPEDDSGKGSVCAY
jgi:hypothetical protein